MGKIFQAIDKQIIKSRVIAAEREGFQMTKEDIEYTVEQIKKVLGDFVNGK